MWNRENRSLYSRSDLRYPSDLTDEEWTLVAPLSPPARPGGRQRQVEIRRVLNGILSVLETGCPWRHLPKDLPPRSTCHADFQLWMWDGTLERLHHHLYEQMREQAGREASPTAAIVDSQSIRSAPKGGTFRDPVGYDGGKKVKGSSPTLLSIRLVSY